MKLILNILVLTLVLSIPFALSQTRKAIPAGRYEALSGIKVSHLKGADENSAVKESLELFWNEVAKQIPENGRKYMFYSHVSTDSALKGLLLNKGIVETRNYEGVNILLSDDLYRDRDVLKKVKAKGALLILKDKRSLKEVIGQLPQFEILLFQAEKESNYFLLKNKP